MSWVGFRRAGPILVAVLRLHWLLPRCERLYAEGRYAEVARLAEKACAIARRQFGEVDRNVADALGLLGLAEMSLGDPASAEHRFRHMVEIRRALYGEADGEVGAALNYLGSSRRVQGDLGEAEELYRRSLAIIEADPEMPAASLATVRRAVGEICIERGKYGEGEALVQSAYDTLVGVLGKDHPELVDTARSLASVHLTCSRPEEAERLLRWCLEVQQRQGLERTPGFAQDLFSLGTVLRFRGRLAEAADLQERALEALGRDHAMYGTALVQLAATRLAAGDPEAEALCDRALDVLRSSGRPGLAAALRQKAEFREARGDLAAAEDLYREAADVGPVQDRIEALLGLSKLLMARAEFNRAETHVRAAAREAWERFGSHLLTAKCFQALSVFNEFTGWLNTAEALSEQVLEMLRSTLGSSHLSVGAALDRLAYLRLQTQGVEAARPLLEEAGAIFAASLGEDHPSLVQFLEHRAHVLRMSGDLTAAEALYRRCLRLRARAEGPRSLAFALCLVNLAMLRLPWGDSPQSERMYRYSLECIRSLFGGDSPLLLMGLRDLAFAYAAAGRIADALTTLDEAAAMDERLMGRIFAMGVEGLRIAFVRDVRGSLEVRLSLVLRHAAGSSGQVAKTFDAVLRRKAFNAAAEAVRRDAVLGGRYPDLAPRLRELAQVQARIAAKVLAGPRGEDLAAYLRALTELSVQSWQLESDLCLKISEMSVEAELRRADRHGVAARLAEGAALVELVRFREVDFAASTAASRPRYHPARYLAFVLLSKRGDGVAMIDLGDADRIDRLVARLTAALTRGADGSGGRELDAEPEDGAPERAAEIARAIRETVFDPLLPALADCRTLVVSPDGDLARLSFDVLPGAESGYLIDEYRIRYVTSGRDLLRAGRPSVRRSDPVVIADPDFDARAAAGPSEPVSESPIPEPPYRGALRLKNVRFRRLEGMRAEGEAVARLLNVEPWLGEDAREGRLKKVESPEILHLATHGFFFETDDWESSPFAWGVADRQEIHWVPDYTHLLSGLALAGINSWLDGEAPPEPEEDGLLNAMDVAALDLLDTELVVLSACETGLGKVHVGEGVLGLRRAFVTAGARTLVVSLWKVPDEPTRELMEGFYHRLLAGEDRAEALREAKLVLRERSADPAWWGAFICQGEDGPLRDPCAETVPAAGDGSGGDVESMAPPQRCPAGFPAGVSTLRDHTLSDTEQGSEILDRLFDGIAPFRRVREVEEGQLPPEVLPGLREVGVGILVNRRSGVRSPLLRVKRPGEAF